LLAWTLRALASCRFVSDIVLVCGCRAQDLLPIARDFKSVVPLQNPNWEQGLATSLRTGLQGLPRGCPGTLVTLGDTPFYRRETLLDVIPQEHQVDEIRLPVYEGVPGHPKYFPAWLFPELARLSQDQGARDLIKLHEPRCRFLEVNDPGVTRDFDTLADFFDS